MSIQKFAADELRMLIRAHGSTLITWAANSAGHPVSPKMKNALLECAARLYECVEELPEAEVKEKTN